MKNTPLMVAAGFTLAALMFLLWSYVHYSSTKTASEDALYNWQSTTSARQRFVDLQADPELTATTKAARESVPAVMGKLVEECKLKVEQMRIDPAGTSAGEESASSVKLTDVDLVTMGTLLDRLRNQHKGLIVREIVMTEPKKPSPGMFNWTLIVGVVKQTATAGRSVPAAAPAPVDSSSSSSSAEASPPAPASTPAEAPLPEDASAPAPVAVPAPEPPPDGPSDAPPPAPSGNP